MKTGWSIGLIPFFVAALASSVFAEDICLTEGMSLVGKRFVAKTHLYDTKVAVEGIIKLEWDRERIPEGAEFEILDVECGGKRMKLTLRQITDRKVDKVEVFFLFKRESRAAPEAKEKLEKIMSYVFSEPEAKETE